MTIYIVIGHFEVKQQTGSSRKFDLILNRPFARWRHFTTTTRIHFVFLFKFKFCNPRGEQRTIALINMIKQKPEGFW